jgi:acetylornithine/succinyldiaminopimelate/putrescine aminotransferase
MGDEYWRNAFRPLLPDILHLEYDAAESLQEITTQTACVIAETIQAERGVFAPSAQWMAALQEKCRETGTLLVLDEIQTGFGRTGTLWGFEQFNIVPDIVLLGKALGGGMPMGAFVADQKIMQVFTENPVLGHITTFGGHPVCCAAGLAAFKVLLKEEIMLQVTAKGALFRELLMHPLIKTVRANGLLIAVEFEQFEVNKKVIDGCLQQGLLTDWFLFAPECMRIAPPLTISEKEIKKAARTILEVLDTIQGEK